MTARSNDRQARLAEALRANLKRRKARDRALATAKPEAEPQTTDAAQTRPNTDKKPA